MIAGSHSYYWVLARNSNINCDQGCAIRGRERSHITGESSNIYTFTISWFAISKWEEAHITNGQEEIRIRPPIMQ